MLPSAALVRAAAAVLLLGAALLPAAVEGAQVRVCGGRSLSVPILGTYSFSVQVAYDDGDFVFRCDGDLHVSNCHGNRVSPATGDVTSAAPCLSALLSKWALTDFKMDVARMPQELTLSATASPMGYALGTMSLQLSQAACGGSAPPQVEHKDEL